MVQNSLSLGNKLVKRKNESLKFLFVFWRKSLCLEISKLLRQHFLPMWTRLFSNHDGNYVGICHVPPWIRRVGYWACKVDNIRDDIHTHLVTLIGTVLKLDGWSFICFFVFFSNCCLAVPQPTLDHSQGDSLTNLMLVTAFVHVQPKGHWEPHNKVGSLSPT